MGDDVNQPPRHRPRLDPFTPSSSAPAGGLDLDLSPQTGQCLLRLSMSRGHRLIRPLDLPAPDDPGDELMPPPPMLPIAATTTVIANPDATGDEPEPSREPSHPPSMPPSIPPSVVLEPPTSVAPMVPSHFP
eukprot:s3673_g6.t1